MTGPSLFLDPYPVFTSNDFHVLAMLKCYIFGLLHIKSLVLFPAFTDLVHHLPKHSDVLKILLKSV